ncbi:MAG: hypothetical protein US49_C0005G0046 [candidate division TM6 bacterium GW2011_GWF2_37_49]|nr:MAG: hypothetical protein US49_C0005G0046 [candidate division TM6 bacterium GW2011_GWF2_37_49]
MNIFKHIQILVLVLAPACLMGMESARETVLDRIEHIEPTIVNIPKIAPLCDEIMELKKSMLDINNGSLYCE